MNPTCLICGHIHASDDAKALGRFTPDGPTVYRASYDGAPIRTTRAEVEADACRHRQETP